MGEHSELKIAAGVSGGIRLFSQKDKRFLNPAVYGDPIPISKSVLCSQCTRSLRLNTASAGDLSFGLVAAPVSASSTYRLFEESGSRNVPLWLNALKGASPIRDTRAISMTLPDERREIAALKAGQFEKCLAKLNCSVRSIRSFAEPA